MSLPPEFLALFGVFVLAAIAPGADFACVLRESVSFGRRAGIASAIGVGSAIMVHVAYTVTGVGLIVAQSVLIFTIVKWCGAAYLVYLGVRSLTARRSSPQGLDRTAATPVGGSRSVVTSYGVGFLTNLLNPKEENIVIFAPELHQEWRFSPPTGLNRIVGSGGKTMRVRMFNSLKINDYGNQEN